MGLVIATQSKRTCEFGDLTTCEGQTCETLTVAIARVPTHKIPTVPLQEVHDDDRPNEPIQHPGY